MSETQKTIRIEWHQEERCHLLSTFVELPVERETLFTFFGDVFQLETITPPWLNFRVTTPAPIEMKADTVIDYQLKLHGIPIRWRSHIPSWDPPYSFIDRQLKGPYWLWEHLHSFETTPTGTLVRDEVKYRVPGGRLINRLFVQKDLERIFKYRQEKMGEIFSSVSSRPFTDSASVMTND